MGNERDDDAERRHSADIIGIDGLFARPGISTTSDQRARTSRNG